MRAGNIKKGQFVRFKGEPHEVMKTEFYAPGKGSAVNRVKMKSMKTGNTIEFTFKSNEEVEELDITAREMQYLYQDGADYVFMDERTYEQVTAPGSLFELTKGYLLPEMKMYLVFFEEKVIGVRFPGKVVLEVTVSEDAVAGNTANAAKKEVEVETGAKVMVPLFVKRGDKIIIETETGAYVSRSNE